MRSTLRNINNIVRISFKNQPKLRVPVTKRTYSENNNQESWRSFSSSFVKNQIIPKSQSAFSNSGANWSLIGGIALGTVASTVLFGYNSHDESAHAKTAKPAQDYLKELENITTWEQGMKILAEAIAEHPKNIDFYIIAQKAAMEGGDLKTSQKYLEQGLKIEPKNPTLWIGKFFFHISEGKPEEALKAINRAIELAPNDHRGYAFRSSYYATHKDYDRAFQDADMAVQKLAKDAPKEERQSVLWGKWLVQIAPFLESQNTDQATRMLDLAIAECPLMMEPVILQFGLHFQNKDVDKAMKSLDKGFKNFPGDSYLYMLKANLLIATGRFKEAGMIIDAMQKVNAKDPTALALQSLMMMMNKKNEEAKKLLELSKQYANSGEAVADPEMLVATWESIEKEIGVSKPAPAKKGWFS